MGLEDELFASRYQWAEMLGNSAMENSPDVMARLNILSTSVMLHMS